MNNSHNRWRQHYAYRGQRGFVCPTPSWKRWSISLAFVSLILLAGVSYRVLADGGLDTGFGGGGKTATDFTSASEDEAYAVAIQPDGRIVVSGSTHEAAAYNDKGALSRYDPDGTLDNSFGTGGKVIATTGSNRGFAVALQPDGKILTSGFSGVTRYNVDGSLDTTFGSGGATVYLLPSYTMIVQPDGKILVGGYLSVSYKRTDFAVGRYNSDGSVDTAFGNGGKINTNIASGHASIHGLALQPDGKIVGVGKADCCGNYWYAGLVRYNGNGTPDTSFGNNGMVKLQFTGGSGSQNSLLSVAVQPDGKLITVGTHLARFNSDGSLDSGFGSGGYLSAGGNALLLQPNGTFFVGSSSNHSFALSHYNQYGALDSGFGPNHNGIVITPIYGNNDGINGLALQPGDKIVAIGSGSKTNSGNGFYADSDFALARYVISAPIVGVTAESGRRRP